MSLIRFPSRRALLLSLVALCVLGLHRLASQLKLSCSNEEGEALRKTLCEEFKAGLVFGNLCAPICDGSVTFLDCVPLHASKRLVTRVGYRDKMYVMKAQDLVIEPMITDDTDYPKWDEFPLMVKKYLAANFGNSNYQHIWSLWTMTPDDFSKIKAGVDKKERVNELYANFLNNFWTLLQNEEYVLSMLFRDKNIFPAVSGSCGGWYMVEHAKPLDVPWGNYIYKDSNSHKVQLLQALRVLEFNKKISPLNLYLCDVKYDHFGVDENDDIKFLDGDAVFHESYFRTGILNSSCRTHDECSFFDCKGACNMKTGRCFPKILNNNLQIICETLFKGRSGRNSILPPGLLSRANSDLKLLLEQCANPGQSRDPGRRDKAPDSLSPKLESLIRREYNLLL